MITRLRIRNFQSLAKLDLQLGQITVIKGPSNTGKSAVVRALSMLAFNSRSAKNYVSTGSKTTVVQAIIDDAKAIVIQRGEGVSEYTLTLGDKPAETYKKCGADVPEDIKPHLRLAPVSFASQFDKPYLTDEAGSTVANTLGDLTDIDTLFAASKEANRRTLEAGRAVTSDAAEIDRIKASITEIGTGIKERKLALAGARTTLDAIAQVQSTSANIRHAADEVVKYEAYLANFPLPKPTPDISPLLAGALEAASRAQNLRAAAEYIPHLEANVNSFTLALDQAQTFATLTATENHDREHQLLKEAGTCPLCLQKTA